VHAYDAPLFLVSADSRVPAEVSEAIREITQTNGVVTVHIVGGPVSVPDARYAEIESYVGGASTLVKDRVLSTGDRYDMAAAIARRVEAVIGTPDTALIANGADETKFFDALALSPITAQNGYPILLVSADSVPAATQSALGDLEPSTIVVAGGPSSVSDNVVDHLQMIEGVGMAERWWGGDRYSTATQIANSSVSRGWLSDSTVAIAAKLPDAVTGGAMVGSRSGPLLITDSSSLSAAPGSWLSSHKGAVRDCYVLGGAVSVAPTVMSQIESELR
jgi:putative cell wall-binding protein